jgi:hypothetical protein
MKYNDEGTWQWAAERIIRTHDLDVPSKLNADYRRLFDNDQHIQIARLAWSQLNGGETKWTVEQQVELLASKQHDYGCENVLKFGVEGIRVRLWDKISRYYNLLKRGVDPVNETLADTLKDMVGYCVLHVMVQQNQFTLPLSGDR